MPETGSNLILFYSASYTADGLLNCTCWWRDSEGRRMRQIESLTAPNNVTKASTFRHILVPGPTLDEFSSTPPCYSYSRFPNLWPPRKSLEYGCDGTLVNTTNCLTSSPIFPNRISALITRTRSYTDCTLRSQTTHRLANHLPVRHIHPPMCQHLFQAPTGL
ncbi:uncharacterized protein BDR25DRAFT_98702 [Lindgomyces ingoldianus]|uniref:Uncharacterized protein n=1 Tax=Lindgomyces ingoldianus TaxID=673940 RepID=A0ACB6QAU0_9PLEO|nr:uncharacterized protein BDR25DRAFT_98702 [Lindgomyces ingoldianus]KAF2464159.1 hypothetical protein BDR25DRAFT_98702 [Lindgomyces ingoldianus]